jgi:flagellar basal body-associated protein FliL
MNNETLARTSSGDYSFSIWIILAAILIVSTVVGIGSISLLNSHQQGQLPTGSQSVPSMR